MLHRPRPRPRQSLTGGRSRLGGARVRSHRIPEGCWRSWRRCWWPTRCSCSASSIPTRWGPAAAAELDLARRVRRAADDRSQQRGAVTGARHRAVLDWFHLSWQWWNPYEGTGTPLAGEMQSAALFPFSVLTASSNGQLWEHMRLELIAGASTFLLMRRLSWGLGRLGRPRSRSRSTGRLPGSRKRLSTRWRSCRSCCWDCSSHTRPVGGAPEAGGG